MKAEAHDFSSIKCWPCCCTTTTESVAFPSWRAVGEQRTGREQHLFFQQWFGLSFMNYFLSFALVFAAALDVSAADYPVKLVRIINPVAPGGNQDIVAR